MMAGRRRGGRGGLLTPVAALVLAGCAALSWGDPEPPPQTDLVSVTFGGEGYHAVELDGYGLATGPHWPVVPELPRLSPDLPSYYRTQGVPVAYTRGSSPEVTLEATVPSDWLGTHRVRGSGGGLTFVGTGEAAEGRLRARLQAEEALPDAVDLLEDLEVTWEVEWDGSWLALGTSPHSLYTVLGDPVGPLVHTPLHISTTRAQGMTETADVIASTWQEFTDLDVRRVRDGRQLIYYGHLHGAPAELRRMLIGGVGQCVSWSYLLSAALGAHGIESTIIMVAPPQRGRLFVKNWEFAEGRTFVGTGANGISETVPAGDDVAVIPVGQGRPHARIWEGESGPPPQLSGDDEGDYRVGENGIVDTRVDTTLAIPLIPFGFGLESQRAYELQEGVDPTTIQLGGDDVIAQHVESLYVLTGPNGILETERQEGMNEGRARGSQWDPVVGRGATSIRFQYAYPHQTAAAEPGGDDHAWGWWIDSGPDGISQTQGADPGQGLPETVAIAPGPNGRIDTRPSGDDEVMDLSQYLDLASEPFDYVRGLNMWARPGVPAQGNPNPPSDYPNHLILKVGDTYYDPSYGTGPFASQLEWERASIAAVGIRIQRDSVNVERNGRIVMVGRKAVGPEPLTMFISGLSPD